MTGMVTNKELWNENESHKRVCWTQNFKDGRQGEKWDTGRVIIMGLTLMVCWR